MILNEKDLQLIHTLPSGCANPAAVAAAAAAAIEQGATNNANNLKKDPELKIEFDGTTVLCRVCGDKASGFHYGVHSCEGCKGFFRRSIQQKIQYRPCTKNQQCSILRVNRNRCQYCRLKKCIAVGMSRDAVRFGRVPKREKAKILAAMQSVNARSQEKALSLELEDEAKLVQTIVKAHDDTCDYTKDKIGPLIQRARDDPVYTQCTPQLACPLNPNPHPLNNGNQRVLEDFSERFSPAIRGVVEFAKRIPGFGLLSQDDQVTLLKAGVFEVLLVRLACMFDSRSNTMICLNGQVLKREALQHTSNARFLMDSMFDFADRLNMLRLADNELGLFCAVVVIAADRPGLRNTELVEKMQSKLMQALQMTVAHSHPQSPGLFQELMKKIPDLRTLNTLHSEKLLAFKMEPHTEANHQTTSPSAPVADNMNPNTTNMHALYQTHVGHWGTYGVGMNQDASPRGMAGSEDSKGSWGEEADQGMPSPNTHLRSQHHPHLQHPHHQHPVGRGIAEAISWSPAEVKESDLYGSPHSSSDTGNSTIEDGSSGSIKSSLSSLSSLKGSTSSGDSEGMCPAETHLMDGQPNHIHHQSAKRRKEDGGGGGSSGDEGSVGDGSNGKCPYKVRKLESPTDSGIESGKELGSSGSSGTQSRSTSICSSPRSSMEDKVKDISDCEASDKHETIEDMPVLKRALQAPPLINTNLLMDEAYKPHKKFRALRKDSDSTPTSPEIPTQGHCPSNTLGSSPSNASLASTHSMLVKTLEQGPQMTEQQLKRTDIIHNIIMRGDGQPTHSRPTSAGTVVVDHTGSYGIQVPVSHGGQLVYSLPQVSVTSVQAASSNGTKNLLVCPPGYYIPQQQSNGGAMTYSGSSSAESPSSSPSSAAWAAFISSSGSNNGNVLSPPSPSQGKLYSSPATLLLAQPQQQQPMTSSSPLQHHYAQPSSTPPSSSASGSGTSPLPRMYYHPRGLSTSSGCGGSPALATTPQSPSSAPMMIQTKPIGMMSSAATSKPTSPIAGQILEQHLTRPSPSSSSSSSSSGNGAASVGGDGNQPLNLSKKIASPPPTSASAQLPISLILSAMESQRIKMEAM